MSIPSFEACPVQTIRRNSISAQEREDLGGHGEQSRFHSKESKEKKTKKGGKSRKSSTRERSSKKSASVDSHQANPFDVMGSSTYTTMTDATDKQENLLNSRKRRPEIPATTPGVQYVTGDSHEEAQTRIRTKDPRLKHRSSIEKWKNNDEDRSCDSTKESPASVELSPGTLYDRKMAAHEATLLRKASLDQDPLNADGHGGAVNDHSSMLKSKYKTGSDYLDLEDYDNEKTVEDYNKTPHDVLKDFNAQHTSSQVISSHGMAGAPEVEYGVLSGGFHENFVDDDCAIAVAVDDSYYDNQDYYHHAIEYNPDAKPPIIKNRRFQLYMILAILLLMAASIGLAVPLALSNSSVSTYSDAPTAAPSSAVEGKYREQFIAVVGSKVNEDDTPHDRAANWIIFEDPQRLTPVSDNLIQRYLLALFYFMTSENEASPWKSCGRPLDNQDSCQYERFTRESDDSITFIPEPATRWLSSQHECEWVGIMCDEGDAGSIVVSIDICKFTNGNHHCCPVPAN